MGNDLEKENKYLKERIEFLETIIELNSETIQKALETNQKLLNHIIETKYLR